jgi:hypothetical protein
VEKLLIGLLAATLYAAMISVGMGRRFDDEIVTRPLVVAGGVLIVIGSYAWYKSDADILVELFIWFAALSVPMWTRSGILYLQQLDRAALARHSLSDSHHDGA